MRTYQFNPYYPARRLICQLLSAQWVPLSLPSVTASMLLFLRLPLSSKRSSAPSLQYLWRFSTLFTIFYAVVALVGVGALEAEHIIVGEDYSAAAAARGPP